MRPSRFIALRGDNKEAFGQILEAAYLQRCDATGTEPDPKMALKERTKLGRAPLVIVAATTRPEVGSREAASPNATKIPWEERRLSTAAAVQNLMLAATSLGYGSMWRTGDVINDSVVKDALGLAADEDIIGFVYLGTPEEGATPPPHQADIEGLLMEWSKP